MHMHTDTDMDTRTCLPKPADYISKSASLVGGTRFGVSGL